jgi:maltose O-acetyltransferase
MLAGELYDPSDEELVADRARAKKLCKKFNDLEPGQKEERIDVLQELFQSDQEMHIEPSFYCDYGYNIQFGDNFYANHNCIILDVNTVTIGDNVMFGPAVQVYAATHPPEAKARNAGRELGYAIEIGDNAWIGGGAIISPGIKIGENVVVGAGSVVTKDMPANVVIGGNPARIIREL